ncbi:DoxX family protein [Antarcticibacterium arcticum]|uniref:DoxX family protein n=1 Tax=Antarcticibacterium arcticum TaxID=2585771 RepID=A0A5B8YL84_9FLAO|nr:DoxX family protein [Antarcticibacterium arcticum]QED38465.1 DoxX family protein [Antarcticibacterium arcticum]
MEYFNPFITEILILLFIIITFLQSGLDKITDWKGNTGWLQGHFSKTFLAGQVPLMLGVILILEVLTGILAIIGIAQLLMNGATTIALYSCVLAAITLLMLLFGQRVAKDYAGAFTITGYFVVVILGVYILS